MKLVLPAVLAIGFGLLAVLTGEPWAPLVAIIALIAGLLLFSSGFALLSAFIIVLVARPADLFPSLAVIQPAKFMAIAALVALLLHKLITRDNSWAYSKSNRWVLLLTAGILGSSILSTDPAASMDFFSLVFLKILVLWVLIINLVDSKERTVLFQLILAVTTAAIGAYAVIANILGATAIEGTRAGFVGYLGDPNDLALTLLIALPFSLEAVSATSGRLRGFFAILAVCAIAGILSTQSRGGFIGLAACVFVLVRQHGYSRWVVSVVVAIGLIAVVLFSGVMDRQTVDFSSSTPDSSAAGRLDAWVAGARMLRYNPLFGVGFNQAAWNYSYYAVDPVSWQPITSHNIFVQAAAETGFAGFIPFMMLVVLSFRSNRRLAEEIPKEVSPLEGAFLRSQLANYVGVFTAAIFLSVAWSWFVFILFAQAASSERNWLGSDRPPC